MPAACASAGDRFENGAARDRRGHRPRFADRCARASQITLSAFARDPQVSCVVVLARVIGAREHAHPIGHFCRNGQHRDAIDRARCNAQLATRAFGADYRVHSFRRADDCIDRTGLDASCSLCRPPSSITAISSWAPRRIRRIEWNRSASEQGRKRNDAVDARGGKTDHVGLCPAAIRFQLRTDTQGSRRCCIGLREEGVVILTSVSFTVFPGLQQLAAAALRMIPAANRARHARTAHSDNDAKRCGATALETAPTGTGRPSAEAQSRSPEGMEQL